MSEKFASTLAESLRARSLPGGGFPNYSDGAFEPDATAWAILGLKAARALPDELAPSRDRLAAEQRDDGRFSLASDHPQAIWPTALAVLALAGSPGHAEAASRAADFLLSIEGKRIAPEAATVLGHDTMLAGWSWIDRTHSWVEPTAMGLMALSATGRPDHERADEATRLLLDRQLSAGGWNYGNTTVFDAELRPMPQSTGVALSALTGRAAEATVVKSLDYLASRLTGVRAPLSLGWGLLALSAWDRRPHASHD